MSKESKSTRSRTMRAVKSSGTSLETRIAAILDDMDLSYESNCRALPGTPDFYIEKYRLAIFVNGCFWHKHLKCGRKMPRTNTDYWGPKLERNRLRDISTIKRLSAKRYKTLVLWECEIKRPDQARAIIERKLRKVRASAS